ncbi:DoxX family protein [Flavobacterium caeni]|uniref:DoxX protein n=1 Tax=Flavobacterium caeni TaxID=490189 RepID=A0A1G5JPP9_9FLAO|nr:DoxX family protein [Flavobacterium caeni]SCY90124.1 DoxX protein [Flavobacterium caeni]
MDNVKKWNKWANAHTNYPLDFLRIALGIFLILKGASFITNTAYLDNILSSVSYFPGGMLTFHYIAAAHIMGGIMIAVGLLTRWAIIAQLPILFGAVIINFIGDFSLRNLMLSLVVLAVCLFFLFYGSGKHSADYFFKMQQ